MRKRAWHAARVAPLSNREPGTFARRLARTGRTALPTAIDAMNGVLPLVASNGDGPIALIFVLAVVAVVIGGIYSWKAHQKRMEELAVWTNRRGLTFHRGKDGGYASRWSHFSHFTTGSNRYAQNIMEGVSGPWHVCCFDYHYETYSTDSKGRRQTSHHWSSNVILDAQMELDPLTIRNETWLDKMVQAVGFDDIDFESNQFSREFMVKAKDKRWAYDVIHTEVMELLLSSPRFHIELGGLHLLVRRSGRFKPQDFEDALTLGSRFLDALPADLARERRRRAGRTEA